MMRRRRKLAPHPSRIQAFATAKVAEVRSFFEKVNMILNAVAAAILFALMVLTFLDVSGRNLFNRPIAGTQELTEISLFLIIFLMLPQVTIRHQHIVVNLLDGLIGNVGAALQRVLAACLGVAMFGVIGWQLWEMADRAKRFSEVLPTLQMPLAPFLYVMAVASAISAIAFVVGLFTTESQDDGVSLG